MVLQDEPYDPDLDEELESPRGLHAPIRIVETGATPLHTPVAAPSRFFSSHSSRPTLAPPVPLTRSRTPDPDPSDDERFVPLSRTSTAPSASTYGSCTTSPVLEGRERDVARANKLARMGFVKPVAPGAGSPSSAGSAPLYADATRAAAGTPVKRGFGGIKSFVQSLTGKS